jgi:hypothetical protein
MNELIRKLNEQAQDWADAHAPYASEEHEYFAEKFAELIVRECIVDFYRNYLDTTSDDDITEQVDRYVKQNFGVE